MNMCTHVYMQTVSFFVLQSAMAAQNFFRPRLCAPGELALICAQYSYLCIEVAFNMAEGELGNGESIC